MRKNRLLLLNGMKLKFKSAVKIERLILVTSQRYFNNLSHCFILPVKYFFLNFYYLIVLKAMSYYLIFCNGLLHWNSMLTK